MRSGGKTIRYPPDRGSVDGRSEWSAVRNRSVRPSVDTFTLNDKQTAVGRPTKFVLGFRVGTIPYCCNTLLVHVLSFPFADLVRFRTLQPTCDFCRAALRLRVCAAFCADAIRCLAGRLAAALPPIRPPFSAGSLLIGLPCPEPPGRLPPPVILLTVAQARFSASGSSTPRLR